MHTHHIYIDATCKRHVEKGLTAVVNAAAAVLLLLFCDVMQPLTTWAITLPFVPHYYNDLISPVNVGWRITKRKTNCSSNKTYTKSFQILCSITGVRPPICLWPNVAAKL